MKHSTAASYALTVKDLQAELGCGPRLARRIAREIGTRLGDRRLVVLRSELAQYLLARRVAGRHNEDV